jgi:hypothetical protein
METVPSPENSGRQPTKGETPTKGGNAFSAKEMRFFYLGATLSFL